MLVGRVWQHQTEGQSVDDFITQVEIAAAQVGLDEINTRYAAINGLLPPIRTFVLGRELTDLAAVRKWGKMAEMCEFDAQVRTKQGVHAITDNMEQMTAGRDERPTSSANTYSRGTTQTAGGPPRGNTGGRGRFGQRSTSYQPRQQYGQNQRQPGRGRPFSQGNGYPRNQGHWNQQGQTTTQDARTGNTDWTCKYCGLAHFNDARQSRAKGVTCYSCGKVGHLSRACMSSKCEQKS